MHRLRRGCTILIGAMAAGCGEDDPATSTGGQAGTATMAASSSSAGSEGAPVTPTTAEGSGSQGNTQGETTATTDPLTGTGTTTTVEPGTTSTDTTTAEPIDPCERDNGGFKFSYLWVANTSQGSISRINTRTMVEEGRYYADATPALASPSRTSVSVDGRFVVVANRNTGRLTKIAANVEDCPDPNGDGVITTSQGMDDLLPWGADECVIWSVAVDPLPQLFTHGPRGTAWAPGVFNKDTCKYENQSFWVGWMDAPGHGVMARFNGDTGVQEATVGLDDWALESNYAPYGAAVDGFGYLWFSSRDGELGRIDTETLELRRWSAVGIDLYGMTVDSQGDVWFGTFSNQPLAMFDAELEQFVQVPSSTENHRGIAVDRDGMVWAAANHGGTHGCGLNQFDAGTMTQVQFHKFPKCGTPVGVSVDLDGFVWMVDRNGWVSRIDPETHEQVQVPIAGDHYTYSDMTGGGLVGAVTPK